MSRPKDKISNSISKRADALFRSGFNTAKLARFFGVTETEALRLVTRGREKRLGIGSSYRGYQSE